MKFEVRNGCFGYQNGKMVLNNISLDIQQGEVLAILGPNGVGKTTLLRNMMGMLKWKSGGSFINDINIREMNEKELWRSIAYVPQAKGIAFSYTVEEMTLMGRSPHISAIKQPSEKDRQKALEALELLKILHLKDKYCNQISGGELQMVLIARALCSEPKMLVLDEPESNLDFRNQLIILNTIHLLAKDRGLCCIFNTHYPAHALKIATNALLISREGHSYFGKAKEVITQDYMKEIFKVSVHIENVVVENLKSCSVTALALE
ncbi:ABC transporter ATP-binding protein [Cytobacillus praedii]|uniref:ABC transporter ATP-binding protein n=1 Tax=Cytobacillus praedii TaxID=1742358 RepID=UPI002E1B551E|nr:ABC transporter ATP-binding protein [Cytobacillus praedii]